MSDKDEEMSDKDEESSDSDEESSDSDETDVFEIYLQETNLLNSKYCLM